MSTPPNFGLHPGELLALPPADLAELVDACPGDYVSARAAVLGLDVAVPEHWHALSAAFPGAFTGLDMPVAAGRDAVRSDLTPDAAPEPEPHTGHPPAPGEQQSTAQPVDPEPVDPDGIDIAELLAAYRGRPDPFLAGTFAMYSAPDGSIVIITEIPGRGVERRDVPGNFVRLALGAAAGKGAGMLGKMFGR